MKKKAQKKVQDSRNFTFRMDEKTEKSIIRLQTVMPLKATDIIRLAIREMEDRRFGEK